MGQLSPFSRWSFSIGVFILLLCGATAVLRQVSQARPEGRGESTQVESANGPTSDNQPVSGGAKP